jgi:hypothetical protein
MGFVVDKLEIGLLLEMGRAKTFYEDTSYSFAIAVTFSLWLLF